MHVPNLTPHGHFNYPIDELALGTTDDAAGRTFILRVFAYGQAIIGYDLAGDWDVIEIYLDGDRNSSWPSDPRRPTPIRIYHSHPLYAIVEQALIDDASTQIAEKALNLALGETETVHAAARTAAP